MTSRNIKVDKCQHCFGKFAKSKELTINTCGHIFCCECFHQSIATDSKCYCCDSTLLFSSDLHGKGLYQHYKYYEVKHESKENSTY